MRVCVCVCVCVCVRLRETACLCICLCLLRGYRQELRSLQLSQWDVNIYDMLFAIWYVWTFSPPDICFRYLHTRITHWNIMRRCQEATEFGLTIDNCFNCLTAHTLQVVITHFEKLLLIIMLFFPPKMALFIISLFQFIHSNRFSIPALQLQQLLSAVLCFEVWLFLSITFGNARLCGQINNKYATSTET